MLETLAKARHPAAKAAKKRSCNAGKPISIHTNEEENASLYKGASALAALRNGPTKKQRSAEGPRALPVNILEGLTKTRHPAAKAVTQTPAKQEVAKKRSCSAGKPISIRTNEEENAAESIGNMCITVSL